MATITRVDLALSRLVLSLFILPSKI